MALTHVHFESGRLGPLTWGIASRAHPESVVTGDRAVVLPCGGHVLVALVDALGHGREAARVADVAVASIEEAARAGEDLGRLFGRCDRALHGDRGVVMSAVLVDGRAGRLEWAGVGNVAGHIVPFAPHRREPSVLVPRGGIVGSIARPPPVRDHALARGDVLVLASDGLRHDYAAGLRPGGDPALVALRTLREHARDTDDACIVVARYDPD